MAPTNPPGLLRRPQPSMGGAGGVSGRTMPAPPRGAALAQGQAYTQRHMDPQTPARPANPVGRPPGMMGLTRRRG